ncbi:MAG TPA: phosphate ABC transporter substrate-binding protein PstS [Streptosporangiaceae bacterium]|jgi:phosphate transport system substrate-binding protein|nr:phosphate ABC transporter substrate-binding protein PstS [Streptosporangiaceae bacterium]
MQRLRRQRFTTAGLALASMALFVAACSSSGGGSGSGSGNSGTLNGSGSTFQLTFQQTAIQSFKAIQPNITVNYGGGGSGKGRTDLASGVVQYAGSDTAPIPSDEVASFKGKTVLYFPVLVGPITVSFNVPGVKSLKLDAPTIAGIFQAKITKWNDSKIAALNPGVKLPSTPIIIARRSDSSGTTQNFSEFLVEGAPGVWKLGSDSTINWPADSRGGNGNGGVAQIVKSTQGAVGYVDYADAKASGLTFASIKNKAGNYIAPSTDSATEAANNVTVKPNLTFSAIWASGSGSYPVTYQSWVLVYQKQSSSSTTKDLKDYVGYLVGDGQKLLPELGYAPLPSSMDQQAKAQLSQIGS